jgi:hypothetical protein
MDGATILGTVPVISGTAAFPTNLTVAGSPHAIQALFNDPLAVYASSSSSVSNLTITALPLTVSGSKTYDGTAIIANTSLTMLDNVDGANLTLSGSAGGSGNGTINFSAAANPGAPRIGSLTIAGRIDRLIHSCWIK